ncbi:MAG: hypothetical protein MI685_12135 [Chlorobiales bacterium]|nr:hypothetical protein [Chlorobiales bacterium]
MTEIHIGWEEFVARHKTKKISPWVDLNKGHALMKSPLGPSNWRVTIKLMTWLTLLAIPTAIVLFFFIKWWIPVIIIVLSFMFMRAIRQEAAKAVIETSLENPEFYSHAILSGTMKIYSADGQNENEK